MNSKHAPARWIRNALTGVRVLQEIWMPPPPGTKAKMAVFSGPVTGEAIMEWIMKNEEEAEREKSKKR
jgi:hypothetical protein